MDMVQFHLYEAPGGVKFIEMEAERRWRGHREGRMGSYRFKERVSVLPSEQVLERLN